MFKFLAFLIMIASTGCNTVSKVSEPQINFVKTETKTIENCSFDWKEKFKTFYSPAPNDFRDAESDSKFLQTLKNCPREETLNSITKLQNENKKDQEIQVKSAYLLTKLKHDEKDNKKFLLAVYPSFKNSGDGFRIDHLMDMICDVIQNDDADKDFLAGAFELVPETNGAMAEMLAGTLTEEFKKNPEGFLKILKPSANQIRREVYSFLVYAEEKDKVVESLSAISKTSDVYSMRKEIEEFAKNNKQGY